MTYCLYCAGRTYTYPNKYNGCICRKNNSAAPNELSGPKGPQGIHCPLTGDGNSASLNSLKE